MIIRPKSLDTVHKIRTVQTVPAEQQVHAALNSFTAAGPPKRAVQSAKCCRCETIEGVYTDSQQEVLNLIKPMCARCHKDTTKLDRMVLGAEKDVYKDHFGNGSAEMMSMWAAKGERRRLRSTMYNGDESYVAFSALLNVVGVSSPERIAREATLKARLGLPDAQVPEDHLFFDAVE
jgi:hypothetical protein